MIDPHDIDLKIGILMARVTVEDCLKNVKNRFELVLIAAKRARQLMRGKEAKVEWDNDKSTVVALREIAAGYTDFDTPETPDASEVDDVLTEKPLDPSHTPTSGHEKTG